MNLEQMATLGGGGLLGAALLAGLQIGWAWLKAKYPKLGGLVPPPVQPPPPAPQEQPKP